MKFYILKTNPDFAVGAVWANHCNDAKLRMVELADILKNFVVS